MQALTSTECKSRLFRQGKRFQQHLTERAALHHLITAVQADDIEAKLLLYGLTKVCLPKELAFVHLQLGPAQQEANRDFFVVYTLGYIAQD